MEDLTFKIIFGVLLCAFLVFFIIGGLSAYEFESKCREQGGVPVKGVCIKAETIKVVY